MSRPQKTLADYIAIAIGPALIMVLVGSFVFFLAAVFYRGAYPSRLNLVLGCFIFASVLIARISIEESRARAMPFAAALAAVTAFALYRFVEYSGPIPPGLSFIVNIALMAVIWWSADKLTYDCTLIDEGRPSTSEGLMQTIGLDDELSRQKAAEHSNHNKKQIEQDRAAQEQQLAAELAGTTSREATSREAISRGNASKSFKGRSEEDDARKKRHPLEEQKRRPHSPGLWVVYVSLAALPIFGFGQLLVPVADVATRRQVFWQFSAFLAAALGLLLTTSFLGLRRYLRQRRVEMPAPMAGWWLVTGAVVVVALLVVTALLPRPGAEYEISSLSLVATSPINTPNRFGMGGEGVETKNSGTPRVDPNQPPPDQNAPQAPGQGRGDSGGRGGENNNSNRGNSGSRGQQSSDQGQQSSRGGNQSAQDQQNQQGDGQRDNSNNARDGNSTQQETIPREDQSQQRGRGQTQGQGQRNQGQQRGRGGSRQGNGSQSNQSQGDQNQSDQNQSDQNQSDQNQSDQNQSDQNQSDQSRGGSGNSAGGARNTQPPRNPDEQNKNENNDEEGNQDENSQDDDSEDASSGGQANDSSRDNSASSSSGAETSAANPEAESDWSNVDWLTTAFKWIIYLAVALVILYVLIRYGREILKGFAEFFRNLGSFLARLFGGGAPPRKAAAATSGETKSKGPPPRPFSSFADPFAAGVAAKTEPNELVRYSFEAFEAWARDRGRPRGDEETPHEFAHDVARGSRRVGKDARNLAELYDRAAYAPSGVTPDRAMTLEHLWERLQESPGMKVD